MSVKLTGVGVNSSLQLKALPNLNSTKIVQFLKPSPQAKAVLNSRKCRHVCQSSAVDEQQISFSEPETHLIDALIGIQGRGKSATPRQLQEVESAVKVLEGLGGEPNPTKSNLIEGRWQLVFTTRPGTASPIQRTFVGVDLFSVFQEVYLQTNDPRVSNIVKFSDAIGELKVEAAAAVEKGTRIMFRFDRAAFAFKFLPFKVPYPVPFKLLGDEAKGWLDTTYLSPSGNLRISKGNKGTTFVLQKKTEPRQNLLTAISTGQNVKQAIDKFMAENEAIGSDELELVEGEWEMIWSSQTETDSWIENAGNGLMGKQIVKKNGELKFVVDILLGLKFSMTGTYQKSGKKTYSVKMDDAAIVVGPYGLPVEMETNINLQLLYSDEKMRISKGYSGIVFVHIRTGKM
ncbi:probable plastid-lipid-associated protein 12, chloroplastic [Mercurialis annua]|uniref:probable plastid-lipid-associated protein 12, chloroplastic n=1 Tax=Mercurialis annua TaxID=3986 RepID=UPI00216058F6|nr:probable plastid-lipid-associated protein 12, chloroplastic [Mercurialis annua]